MLSTCYKRIDDKTVNRIFQNFTVINLSWNDSYEAFLNIDYSILNSDFGEKNLEITDEQKILFAKLDRAREEFMAIHRLKQTLKPQTLNLFGIDFSNIGEEVELVLLGGFLAFVIFGILFLLYKLNNKNDKNKKKKNK